MRSSVGDGILNKDRQADIVSVVFNVPPIRASSVSAFTVRDAVGWVL